MSLSAGARVIRSLEDLRELARDLLSHFSQKQIVILSGPTGAGKTQFVKELAKVCDVSSDLVTSPTYSLHHRYQTSQFFIDHFDLYRIRNRSDLESTGFWDTFFVPQGLVIIEWGEIISKEDYPESWKIMHLIFEIDPVDAGSRFIDVQI